MNLINGLKNLASEKLGKLETLAKSTVSTISSTKKAILFSLGMVTGGSALADDITKGFTGHNEFNNHYLSTQTLESASFLANMKDAGIDMTEGGNGTYHINSLQDDIENGESQVNPLDLDVNNAMEFYNNLNNILYSNGEIIKTTNDFKFSGFTFLGGKFHGLVEIDSETKSGHPLSLIRTPLNNVLSSIASENPEINRDKIRFSIGNNSETNTVISGANFSIENNSLIVDGFLGSDVDTYINAYYYDDNNEKVDLGVLEVYVKKSERPSNYVNISDVATTEEKIIKIQEKVTRSTVLLNEEGENVISPVFKNTQGEFKRDIDLERVLSDIGITNISEMTSLDPNFRVSEDGSLYPSSGVNSKVKTLSGGRYANFSGHFHPNKSTTSIVPVEIELNDGTKTMVNLEIKTLPGIEIEEDNINLDVSIENEHGAKTYKDGVEFEYFNNGNNNFVKVTLTPAFFKRNTITNMVSRFDSSGIINENDSLRVSASGFEGCSNIDIEDIRRRGAKDQQLQMTMICAEGGEENKTYSFDGELDISTSVAYRLDEENIPKISLNFGLTIEEEDNSIQILPDPNNPNYNIVDYTGDIIHSFQVTGNIEIDTSYIPEGLSCNLSGDQLQVIMDPTILLSKNDYRNTEISGTCVINNIDTGEKVNISVNHRLSSTIPDNINIDKGATEPNTQITETITEDFQPSNGSSAYIAPWQVQNGNILSVTVNGETTTYNSSYDKNIIIPRGAKVELSYNTGNSEGEQTISYKGLVTIKYSNQTLEKINSTVNCEILEDCHSETLEVTSLGGKDIFIEGSDLQDPISKITITKKDGNIKTIEKGADTRIQLEKGDKIKITMFSQVVTSGDISIGTEGIINLSYSIKGPVTAKIINIPTTNVTGAEYTGFSTGIIAKFFYPEGANPEDTIFSIYKVKNGEKVYLDEYLEVIQNTEGPYVVISISNKGPYLSPEITSLTNEVIELGIEAENASAGLNYDSLSETENNIESRVNLTGELQTAPEIVSGEVLGNHGALEVGKTYTATIQFNESLVPNNKELKDVESLIKNISIESTFFSSQIGSVQNYTINEDTNEVRVTFSISKAPFFGLGKIIIETGNIPEILKLGPTEDQISQESSMDISVKWF